MTESEEMYLVTIARLQETGIEGAVPLARLAEALEVGPVSVNQMIRKLEECSLVAYTPYKGVELTPAGSHTAFGILRHRRVWEVFLVEHLHFSPAEAETLACRMEHILPPEGIERLAVYLGNPAFNPAGLPIPGTQVELPAGRRLDQLNPGKSARIASIQAGTSERSFLSAEGIYPGVQVALLGIGCEGSVLLKIDGRSALHLSSEVAQTIFVE